MDAKISSGATPVRSAFRPTSMLATAHACTLYTIKSSGSNETEQADNLTASTHTPDSSISRSTPSIDRRRMMKYNHAGPMSDVSSDGRRLEEGHASGRPKRAFSANDLANWVYSHDGGSNAKNKKLQTWWGDLQEKVNDKFHLDHKGWFYYMVWYVVVCGFNIPLHYKLIRNDIASKDTLFLLSMNLFICIFSRTVWFKWMVYVPTLATKYLPPIALKGFLNKVVVNNGGVHTCSAYWLVLDAMIANIHAVVDGAGGTTRSAAHFFFGVATLMVLLFIVLLALPFRHKAVYHEMFEYSHRYGGWFISSLYIIDLAISISAGGDEVYGLTDAAFWLILASIFLVVYPWVGILKRYNADVYIFSPSKFLAIVTWKPSPWLAYPGTAGQLAFENHGVKEYHSFACLPHLDDSPDSCAMGVALAGDWTSKLIKKAGEIKVKRATNPKRGLTDLEEGSDTNAFDPSEPNYKMCIGRVAAPGFMYLARNYRRVVCLGTGSGIAPIASFLPSPPCEMMILWVGRHLNSTYGPLFDLVNSYHNTILIDTKVDPSEANPYTPRGSVRFARSESRRTLVSCGEGSMVQSSALQRPDLASLAMAAVDLFQADAFFIVSGPKATFETCQKLWKVGIHAYGATWDS